MALYWALTNGHTETAKIFQEALDKLEKARLKAEETLSADRAQLQTASKQHQKFVELTDAHAKEAGRETERKEELELEEVAGILHEREEWGGDAVLLRGS